MVYGRSEKVPQLSDRERLLMREVGSDRIDSASIFVEYISSEYSISKSSVWYSLNSLKDKGIVQFADRYSMGEPLVLTGTGLELLSGIELSEPSSRASNRRPAGVVILKQS